MTFSTDETLPVDYSLLESLPVGVVMQAKSGKIIATNETACKILGMSKPQMLGKTSQDPEWSAIREDGSPFPGNEHPAMQSLATGIALRDVVMGLQYPSKTVWISINSQPLYRDDEKSPYAVATSFSEITRFKEAEAEIHKLIQTVEQSPNSMMITDLNGNIEYINATMAKMSGYDRDELIGQNASLLSAGTTPVETYKNLWAQLAQGKTWRGELHNRRKNGELYIEFAHISPLREINGSHSHYLGIKQDITEHKNIDHELDLYRHHLEEVIADRTKNLTAAESQLRTILETTVEGIYGVDKNGAITFANAAACRMLGYAPWQCVGRNSHDLIHNKYKDGRPYPKDECPMCLAKVQGKVITVDDEVFWSAKGEPIPVRYTIAPMLKEGIHEGAVVSFTDISDRLIFEEELIASRQAAEAANLAKSAFLANMSHEIRTPMNAVIALSHLMLQDASDPKQKTRLSKVVNSAQHLLALINDILDLSKIEAGHLKLENIDFELGQVLDIVNSQIEDKVTEKGLDWEIQLDPEVPHLLHGDPLRVRQVLLNFVGNAVKFTETGMVRLSVTKIRQEENIVRLRFDVTDTGSGFGPEVHQRLFQAFEQADASTTRTHGGTGLGLAICRRIAELMHGEVGAESTPGKGSTFSFVADFQAAEQEVTPIYVPDFSTFRALVVGQDCAETQFFLSELSQLGVKAYLTPSAIQAAVRVETAQQTGGSYQLIFFHGRGLPAESLCDTRSLQRLRHLKLRTTPALLWIQDLSPENQNLPIDKRFFDAILPANVTASVLGEILSSVLCEIPEASKAPKEIIPAPVLAPILPASQLAIPADVRILLVEDNPINQDVALDILETLGLHADVAENGLVAVEQVQKRPYDLILMDMQMPVMDGLQATQKIRSLPGMAKLPILAMTANAFEEDRQKCLQAGMNDHMAKPLTPKGLAERLSYWLKRLPPSTEAQPLLLDIKKGLLAIAGRKDKYLPLLQKLTAFHAPDCAAIRTEMATGDFAVAQRIAHSLKGSAATLGAMQVAQKASEIEQCFKLGQTEMVPTLVDELEIELEQLASKVDSLAAPGMADSTDWA